jgi:acyl carrier protein
MTERLTFDAVFTKVKAVVAEVFDTDVDKLSLETRFREDLDAESLDLVTMLMEFEDAFDKKILDEDAEQIVTIGDAVNYIMGLESEPVHKE